MLAKFIFACVFVSLISHASAWNWGPCSSIPLQSDFELQSYLGEWRQAARMIGTPFESGNCGYAKYSLKANGQLKINNTEILEDGSTNTAIGSAYQTKRNPAALRLTFFWPFYGDYNVVETDYDDFSVVYSCSNYWIFHTELAWILTRNKNFDAENSEQIETLASLGVNKSEMLFHNLNVCPDSI